MPYDVRVPRNMPLEEQQRIKKIMSEPLAEPAQNVRVQQQVIRPDYDWNQKKAGPGGGIELYTKESHPDMPWKTRQALNVRLLEGENQRRTQELRNVGDIATENLRGRNVLRQTAALGRNELEAIQRRGAAAIDLANVRGDIAGRELAQRYGYEGGLQEQRLGQRQREMESEQEFERERMGVVKEQAALDYARQAALQAGQAGATREQIDTAYASAVGGGPAYIPQRQDWSVGFTQDPNNPMAQRPYRVSPTTGEFEWINGGGELGPGPGPAGPAGPMPEPDIGAGADVLGMIEGDLAGQSLVSPHQGPVEQLPNAPRIGGVGPTWQQGVPTTGTYPGQYQDYYSGAMRPRYNYLDDPRNRRYQAYPMGGGLRTY